MEKRTLGAIIGGIFKLNLQRLTRGFYVFTIGAVAVGAITYYSVNTIWKSVVETKYVALPKLIAGSDLQIEMTQIGSEIEKFGGMESVEMKAAQIEVLLSQNSYFKESMKAFFSSMQAEEMANVRKDAEAAADEYFTAFAAPPVTYEKVAPRYGKVRDYVEVMKTGVLLELEASFNTAENATNNAFWTIVFLTGGAIFGMVGIAVVLSRIVSVPITGLAASLVKNSRDIEAVTAELSGGAKKQTEIVLSATKDLEDMIINIIQGSISLSVEKQSEIAKAFAHFLRQFVERTSAEIAMGMMSVSQQSQEARKSIESFVKEFGVVEETIRRQERAVEGMVATLKQIVAANEGIKKKAAGSTAAADKASEKVAEGEKRIKVISQELEDIRTSSEGVREITESLAKITENIKILALNMSLKVEDVRDDTGKSYGFETMSARVQELAEEVEGLLVRSKELIIPTIEGIGKVSREANQTRELMTEVAGAIMIADEASKSIAGEIDRQASQIGNIEIEAEKLRSLAHDTTQSISSQTALAQNVDTILKDSETLIETVNSQTKEASDNARKINEMMEELKKTVASIEDGTGKLTEKSAMIAELFDGISAQAVKNLGGAERLEIATGAVRDVTRRLTIVVSGEVAETKAAPARGLAGAGTPVA
ncbi:MAG: hypothetical protein WA162_09275 [Thermodesulfobacteriota bacterium]